MPPSVRKAAAQFDVDPATVQRITGLSPQALSEAQTLRRFAGSSFLHAELFPGEPRGLPTAVLVPAPSCAGIWVTTF